MSGMRIVKTRLNEGVWEGIVYQTAQTATAPVISVTHLGKPIEGVALSAADEGGHWVLRVPIPAECIADGVQTFLVKDATTQEVVSSFAIYAGDVLDDDIRAEISLLREELDMLKRAFRRHCVETA